MSAKARQGTVTESTAEVDGTARPYRTRRAWFAWCSDDECGFTWEATSKGDAVQVSEHHNTLTHDVEASR